MPVMTVDEKKYGRLLAKHLPAMIDSDEEQDRLVDVLVSLTNPAKAPLTPEERKLVDLIGHLVEQYEDRQRKSAEATERKPAPLEMLVSLMEIGELRQADFVDVFGSQGNVSEVLAGKRKINLRHARRLADRFGMPIETFIA